MRSNDRLREELGRGAHFDLSARSLQWQAVRHSNGSYCGGLQALKCVARQYGMRASAVHLFRAIVSECPHCIYECAARINEVIDDQNILPVNLTDDVHDLRFIRLRPSLVNQDKIGAE